MKWKIWKWSLFINPLQILYSRKKFSWKVIQRGQYHFWASLVVQLVQNLPSMQETQVRSLGQEHPLEKGMATHTSNLAWRISWTEDPGGFQSMGSQRVGHDWVTNTHNIISIFLPVNSKSSEQFHLEMIDMANLVWWPPRHDDIRFFQDRDAWMQVKTLLGEIIHKGKEKRKHRASRQNPKFHFHMQKDISKSCWFYFLWLSHGEKVSLFVKHYQLLLWSDLEALRRSWRIRVWFNTGVPISSVNMCDGLLLVVIGALPFLWYGPRERNCYSGIQVNLYLTFANFNCQKRLRYI